MIKTTQNHTYWYRVKGWVYAGARGLCVVRNTALRKAENHPIAKIDLFSKQQASHCKHVDDCACIGAVRLCTSWFVVDCDSSSWSSTLSCTWSSFWYTISFCMLYSKKKNLIRIYRCEGFAYLRSGQRYCCSCHGRWRRKLWQSKSSSWSCSFSWTCK